MKNKKYLLLLLICIISIIGIFIIIKNNKLDINSELVKTLYSYLGEIEIEHCGGLTTYSEGTINSHDLSLENKLCMAYYKNNNKQSGTLEITKINENKNKICKEGDITLVADSESNRCSYTKVNKNDLNQAYKQIYGEEINSYQTFNIASDSACYEKGEEYICGNSETFSYSLSPSTTIYRLLTKATENKDEIILTDYFLKISDNKCFIANEGTTENEKCSTNLKDAGNIDSEFILQNGTKYEHIFKKNSDDTYYWYQSFKK